MDSVSFIDADEVGKKEDKADYLCEGDTGHASQLNGLRKGTEDEEDGAGCGGEDGGARGSKVVATCGYPFRGK